MISKTYERHAKHFVSRGEMVFRFSGFSVSPAPETKWSSSRRPKGLMPQGTPPRSAHIEGHGALRLRMESVPYEASSLQPFEAAPWRLRTRSLATHLKPQKVAQKRS
jgi:hypothetical protein